MKRILFNYLLIILLSLVCDDMIACCDCNNILYPIDNLPGSDCGKEKIDFAKGDFSFSYFKGCFFDKYPINITISGKKPEQTNGFNLHTITTGGTNQTACRAKFISIDGIPCLFISNQVSGPNQSNNNKLLVFYHGNGCNIWNFCDIWGFCEERNCNNNSILNLLSSYYDILVPELPGYTFNQPKNFTKDLREQQIEAISKWCCNSYPNNFISFGHSLGCHFAILLAAAAVGKCKHLVIANPFKTDKTAAKHTVGHGIYGCDCCDDCCCRNCCSSTLVTPVYKEKLNNVDEIKKVQCPVDIFYSYKDEVIDPHDAEVLYGSCKTNEKLLPHVMHSNYLYECNSVKKLLNSTKEVKVNDVEDTIKNYNRHHNFNLIHNDMYTSVTLLCDLIRLSK